jgi:hypothetical protein
LGMFPGSERSRFTFLRSRKLPFPEDCAESFLMLEHSAPEACLDSLSIDAPCLVNVGSTKEGSRSGLISLVEDTELPLPQVRFVCSSGCSTVMPGGLASLMSGMCLAKPRAKQAIEDLRVSRRVGGSYVAEEPVDSAGNGKSQT